MPQKKKRGVDDQQCLAVQSRTFTNWVNDKLTDPKINNLAKQLDDGTVLIELLQNLSGKIVPERHPGKPTKASHRSQNLSAVFSFITDVERLPKPDTNPSHITKHSLGDILNLLWLIISHYSWSETVDDESRAMLLDWVNTALPDRNITDFTTCWSDGVNLLALVNWCRPGLVPDLSSINPASGLDNIKLAMRLAKENFFIPEIIAPQDLAVDRPDERSVLTYLSYFSGPKSSLHKALFLWVKQQMPETIEVTNLGKDWVDGRALGALVNTLSSGRFPEYKQFDSSDSVANCQTAMDAANVLLEANKTVSPEQFADSHLNPLRRCGYLLQLHRGTLKVTVEDVHRPSDCGASQMMWVDFSLPGGDLSMIKSSANAAKIGVLETVNEELKEGKYRVSIVTERPDEYSLSVTVGGVSVAGSPFTCSLTAPDPYLVHHLNTVLPRKVGIPVILSFDLSHAGHGELNVEAVGSLSGPTPVVVDNSDPASQKVSFIPLRSEKFTVIVKFNEEAVPGSPFELPLDTLIHPESIQLSTVPSVLELGEPVVVTFDSGMAGDGKLETSCIGDTSGEVSVTQSEQATLTQLSFIPAIEDMYYLSVMFDGAHVTGSPLKIDLYPQPPNAQKVKVSSPPSGALETGFPIAIGFDTTHAGQGDMTATCHAKTHGEIPLQVDKAGKHAYQLSFTPPNEDIYSIQVLWSDEPIKGSPFKLDLVSKDHPEPGNCKIIDAPRPSDLILIDEEIVFRVSTKEAGRGPLTATVEQADAPSTKKQADAPTSTKQADSPTTKKQADAPTTVEQTDTPTTKKQADTVEQTDAPTTTKQADAPTTKQPNAPTTVEQSEVPATESEDEEDDTRTAPQVSKNSEYEYKVSYMPLVAGEIKMVVQWAGQPIPGSPVSFTAVAPQIACMGSPVVVNLKTIYKRKHLKACAISRSGGPQLKVRMDKVASGDYKLVFQPTEPGVYLLHVSTKGRPIPNSPFIIKYVDSNNPAAIKISGLKEAGMVGEPLEFVIDAKDAGFGDVTVAPLGSLYSMDSALTRDVDVRSIYLRDNKDGTFSAVFTPESAGDTSLDIRFGGAEVPGSPFPVSVLQRTEEATPSTTPSKKGKSKKKSKSSSLISGLNLENEKFMVGTAHKFKIHCDDLGEGDLVVATKPHSAADIDVTHVAHENAYWVEIIPKKPGKNDIIVKFEGSHILGSPFRTQFLSRGDAAKCMMMDTPPECQRNLDNQVSFCISSKGAGKGKITASVKSLLSKSDVPSEAVRVSKHHYHVLFSPNQGLNYLMSVRYDEVHITGSPYKISLGDASLCSVEGEGLRLAWSGRWNTFKINVADAGPGELTVDIERDDPEEEVEGMKTEQNISNLDEDHYDITYQPFFPGKYWITVKWGKINIPGSPFDVTCLQPLRSEQFSVDPVTLIYQDKPAQLRVTCDSVVEENDKLTVSVRSQEEHKISGEVAKNDDCRSYTCTISAQELETYFVYVLWDEQHVQGSPFEIKNILPPTLADFSVCALASGDGVIAVTVAGPLYSLRYGLLTAAVCDSHDSSLDLPVNISRFSDEESSVDFSPQQGGEYKLSLFYDSEDIVGSPFQLISTDASLCYARGKGLSGGRINEWAKFSVFTENGGPGELRVEVEGENQGEGDFLLNSLITAASDTRYDVSYCPTVTGPYRISVFWDIQHVPGSPFNVVACDPHRYSVPKCPTEGIVGRPIRVGVKELTSAPDFEQLEVYMSTKDHIRYPGTVEKGADEGLIGLATPPKVGKYMIHVQCNGFEIEQSPFKVKVYPPPRPEQVSAEGPGLADSSVGETGSFEVNVAEAGHGYLSFKIQGPKGGFKINLQRDGEDNDKILADYHPTHAGAYIVSLLWAGEHIPNSPFTVTVAEVPPPQAQQMSQLQEAQAENE